MLIGGIILLILGLIGIIFMCIGLFGDHESIGIAGLGMFIFTPMGIIFTCNASSPKTPTDDDVLNGKAVYIETTHICKGDTVKTYRLEWKVNE